MQENMTHVIVKEPLQGVIHVKGKETFAIRWVTCDRKETMVGMIYVKDRKRGDGTCGIKSVVGWDRCESKETTAGG